MSTQLTWTGESNTRNYNVKLTHDKDAGTYTASWGTKTTQTAFSAATALRMLADEFDVLDVLGSPQERIQNYTKEPDLLCKYCKAPIFFAILPSGKYLAFDVEPVDSGELAPNERYAIFPKTMPTARGQKPLAVWKLAHADSSRPPAFVVHPTTCGDTVTEPTSVVLKNRWTQNRTISQERRDKVIQGLRNIKAEIAQGALDDPHDRQPDLRRSGNNRT